MLQDIGQGLFRNEYMPVPPQKEDIVFSFDGGKTLLREGEEGIEVPLVGSLKEAELPPFAVSFSHWGTVLLPLDGEGAASEGALFL